MKAKDRHSEIERIDAEICRLISRRKRLTSASGCRVSSTKRASRTRAQSFNKETDRKRPDSEKNYFPDI